MASNHITKLQWPKQCRKSTKRGTRVRGVVQEQSHKYVVSLWQSCQGHTVAKDMSLNCLEDRTSQVKGHRTSSALHTKLTKGHNYVHHAGPLMIGPQESATHKRPSPIFHRFFLRRHLAAGSEENEIHTMWMQPCIARTQIPGMSWGDLALVNCAQSQVCGQVRQALHWWKS